MNKLTIKNKYSLSRINYLFDQVRGATLEDKYYNQICERLKNRTNYGEESEYVIMKMVQ